MDAANDPLQLLQDVARQPRSGTGNAWTTRVDLLAQIMPAFAVAKAGVGTGRTEDVLTDPVHGHRLRGLYHDHWKQLTELVEGAVAEGKIELTADVQEMLGLLGEGSPHIPLDLPSLTAQAVV